jgi:hypothetical protein
MNPEHVKELVTTRMQQATECLEDGRYLLSAARGTRTAVNRAYYAAFYAVLALLQTIGLFMVCASICIKLAIFGRKPNPKFSLEVYKQRVPIKDPAVLERHIAALRKAGLK